MYSNKELKELIENNIVLKKKYPNFPSLPKIVKFRNGAFHEIKEINALHTHSVFSGYTKRIKNFLKHTSNNN